MWTMCVTDAEKGYVLGVDFFGPFDPDVDNNVYGMIGVEVEHTRYGMVELMKNREAKNAIKGRPTIEYDEGSETCRT